MIRMFVGKSDASGVICVIRYLVTAPIAPPRPMYRNVFIFYTNFKSNTFTWSNV